MVQEPGFTPLLADIRPQHYNDTGIPLYFAVLTDCFKYYDKSGDGIIDRQELPEALRFAGINPSQHDIEIIIKLFDTNRKLHIY